MTTALEIITRSLKLINIPGRGADLQPEDTNDGLVTLQEILASESVSKQFVPGITRHFFNMVEGQSIYSYGPSPQADLRSDDFNDNPAPIKIEDAYIREGSTITNNEKVDEYRFENVGSWVEAGLGDIANNVATLEGIGSVTQTLNLTQGLTYTVRVDVEVFQGTVQLLVQEDAADLVNVFLDSSGAYSFDFTVTASMPTYRIRFATFDVDDDAVINTGSIIERGFPRLELPDSQGSDYTLTIIDQKTYNRRFSKGTGGRPYEILYTRSYELGEIRFDNSAVSGDILVMDVLVNKVQATTINSVIRINPEAEKWLRYHLADCLSGQYGKSLNLRQLKIMEEAWDALASSNRRQNMLRVDRYLRDRPTFDINRGDP